VHLSTSDGYRADIDGLRAIAVLAVIGFHAFPSAVAGGFVGVDIFFVISGYLISSIIFKNLDKGSFSLAEFYSRRIKRIFPSLLLVLLSCLAFGWFVLLADEYAALGKHVVGAAAFASNFLLWRESGYFDTVAESKPLLHLWSLGVEEQFYLVWPLLCVLAFRVRIRPFVIISAIGVASFLLNVFLVDGNATHAFYSPLTRFWELLIGAFLAHMVARCHLFDNRGVPDWLADLVSVFGLICILGTVFGLSADHAFPGWWALLPAAGACILVAAGPHAVINQHLLSRPVLVWIGLISYPLYLWHWPLLSIARIIGYEIPSLRVRVVAVVLSFVLAWLSYTLVEKPIRFGVRPEFKVPLLIVCMIVIAGSAYSIHLHRGFAFRNPELEQRLLTIKRVSESTASCRSAMPFHSRYCLIDDASRPPSVVLLGDSHSNALYIGLNSHFASVGDNLLQLGGGGCLPLFDIETGSARSPYHCHKQMQPLLEYVLATDSIETVILMYRGALYLEGTDPFMGDHDFFIRNVRTSETDRVKIYNDALANTLGQFNAAGKKIVLIIDAPELDEDPLKCLNQIVKRPMSFGITSETKCPQVMRSSVDSRNRSYIRSTVEVAKRFPQIKVLNIQDILCDDRYCYSMRDGNLLYRDADHLSEMGARYVGSRLWTHLNSN
jgi:peptidoglycan/LPS O-acetylase OafA/YrhL